MQEPPRQAMEIVLDRLRDTAARDSEFRAALRQVIAALAADLDAMDARENPARQMVAAEQSAAPPASTLTDEKPLRSDEAPRPMLARPAEVDATRHFTPAVVGSHPNVVSTPHGHGSADASRPFDAPMLDPALVVRRAQLKARACRWVTERRRLLLDGGRDAALLDVHERDRELFTLAKALPNCYLWMMDPRGVAAPEGDALRNLASCYDALSGAMTAVLPLAESGEMADLFEEGLYLLAEAQSALRVGLTEVSPTLQDTDQRETFFWLRRQTAERGVYIGRHMRIDDAADPASGADLAERVSQLRIREDQRLHHKKSRQTLMGKARYHANHALDADGTASLPDWQKLLTSIEELVGKGVPPSDVEIRQLLVPVLDEMPDAAELQIGPGVQAVLDEIDRHLSAVNRDAQREARERTASPEIAQVAERLRGKKVVLIGGVARPFAAKALEQAFALDELVWVTTRSHQSTAEFESIVARPETALVMLAIRWSSHSFGDVKVMCDRHHKPFVRLPAGYNPDQVARQILQQVSESL